MASFIFDSDTITDNEDSIEIESQLFHKPFVEKPVSAEDHNVYIYFPAAAGGGSQRLFRKVTRYVRMGVLWFGLVLWCFNNISVISWRSVLLVEETGGPGENH